MEKYGGVSFPRGSRGVHFEPMLDDHGSVRRVSPAAVMGVLERGIFMPLSPAVVNVREFFYREQTGRHDDGDVAVWRWAREGCISAVLRWAWCRRACSCMWLSSKLAAHEYRRFLFEATPANVPELKRGPCPNGRNVWGLDKSAPAFLDFGVRALQLSHTTPCLRRERLNVRRLVLYPRRAAAAAENYRNEMRSRHARYGCAFGCTIAAPRSSLAMAPTYARWRSTLHNSFFAFLRPSQSRGATCRPRDSEIHSCSREATPSLPRCASLFLLFSIKQDPGLGTTAKLVYARALVLFTARSNANLTIMGVVVMRPALLCQLGGREMTRDTRNRKVGFILRPGLYSVYTLHTRLYLAILIFVPLIHVGVQVASCSSPYR
jgi:hypothetical protein